MEPEQQQTVQPDMLHDLRNANHTIAMGALLLSRLWGDLTPHLDELFEQIAQGHEGSEVYKDVKQTLPLVVKGISDSAGKIEQLLASSRERKNTRETVAGDA